MLKKSRRNLHACTEIGLIGRTLDLLHDCDDMSAGESADLILLEHFEVVNENHH